MVSLYTAWFNFVRAHKSLNKQTPAMAAGLVDRAMTMEEIADMIEDCPEYSLISLVVMNHPPVEPVGDQVGNVHDNRQAGRIAE